MPIFQACGAVFEALYPERCAACDCRVDRGVLCDACEVSLYPIDAACPTCAIPIDSPHPIVCGTCARTTSPLSSTSAPYRFGGVLADIIRGLKFHGKTHLARSIAKLTRQPLIYASAHCDLVVPIPLHWRRRVSRGFNQVELVARLAIGRRALSPALIRTRRTETQMSLDPAARARNVHGAFRIGARWRSVVAGRTILLVDDVMTTGATMHAAAQTLRDAGASDVHGFVWARAEAP